MNLFSEHPFESTRPESLPVEFDASARQIDGLIRETARRDLQTVTQGMSDRVFEASMSMLPRREMLTITPRRAMTQVGSYRLLFANMNLGRFAMAAMVLLAFGIGAMMMHTSGVKTVGDGLALKDIGRDDRARLSGDASSGGGAGGVNHLADWEVAVVAMASTPGSVDEINDKVSYLLEADTLTTPEDVRSDMAQLLASLE